MKLKYALIPLFILLLELGNMIYYFYQLQTITITSLAILFLCVWLIDVINKSSLTDN